MNNLILGKSEEKLKDVEHNSVHAVITDPPYGISFMSNKWDYDVPSIKIWKECYRVLKPGGHLLSFSSPRTYHRLACNVEDAGFEIRDQIMWLYGTGFPKNLDIGKGVDKLQGNKRESLGYYDPRSNQDNSNRKVRSIGKQQVASYNSSLVEKTKGFTKWEGWGTALKPAHEPILVARKPISEKTIVENVLLHETGAINIDKSRVDNGRYPTNFIHDGSTEDNNIKNFFYSAKPSVNEKGVNNTHPTVKPLLLMKYLINLVCQKNQIILDPFLGSGTTGLAANELGIDFIGIESNQEYFNIAKKRLEKIVYQKNLFI